MLGLGLIVLAALALVAPFVAVWLRRRILSSSSQALPPADKHAPNVPTPGAALAPGTTPAPPSPFGGAAFSAGDINNSRIVNVHGDVHHQAVMPSTGRERPRSTLPGPKPFVGRTELIKRIEKRMKPGALIGLCGPPGAGKSALALDLATRAEARFPRDRHWLDLRQGAPTSALRSLLLTLGSAVAPGEETFEALAQRLRAILGEAPALLVIDNAESVASSSSSNAEVVKIIRTLHLPPPGVTLVTSRIFLDPALDERVDKLIEGDALALLEARDIDVASQREAAERLAERLGYLALALTITSGRMRTQRPTQSCAEALRDLEGSPSVVEKLCLPQGEGADESVKDSFALSYIRLSPELRYVFHALGVCASSGAPLDGLAAVAELSEEVTQERMLALSRLSLVEYGAKRASLHPLLHDYARARGQQDKAEWTDLVVRHARWFGERLGGAYQRTVNADDGVENGAALVRIDGEIDNVREAQEHVIRNGFADRKLALTITDDLEKYWALRGESFERRSIWLEHIALVARKLGDKRRHGNVLQASGDLCMRRADLDGAHQAYEQALSIFRDIGARLGQANVLQASGDLCMRRADLDGAHQAYEQALSIFRDIGARLGQANVLQASGDLCMRRADLDGAHQAYEQALSIFRDIGARLGQANVYTGLGRLTDLAEHFERAIALHASIQSPYAVAIDKFYFGRSRKKKLGDKRAARRLLTEARDGFQQLGLPHFAKDVEAELRSLDK